MDFTIPLEVFSQVPVRDLERGLRVSSKFPAGATVTVTNWWVRHAPFG